ncbi:MAG TPA: hypothetical protein VFH73_18580 [Polyangia bacterium]|nr:hypothetical protein [Polyangia bacterium]
MADVDADDSADILVVSNKTSTSGPRQFPTLQVTIPKVMRKHWLLNNTFRTNAQIDGLNDCAPVVIP